MKIRLDLAEILRFSKLDWHDGGGKEKEGRRREGGEESYFVIVYFVMHYLFVCVFVCL